jgi:hypothetical protein
LGASMRPRDLERQLDLLGAEMGSEVGIDG